MFKKILLTLVVMVYGTALFAADSNGLTDNWNFKIPQDMSGQRVDNNDLAGCEYYVLTTSQAVMITSPTYKTGGGTAGAMLASERTCPVKWEALVYAVHVSSALIGNNIATQKGFLVLKDTTSATSDDITNIISAPISYAVTEHAGYLKFDPPIRVSNGLCGQIDIDNTLTDGIYAAVYFRRIKKN